MTDTRAVSFEMTARNRSGSTMPVRSTGSRVVCHPRRPSAFSVLSTGFVLDCAGNQMLSAGRLERLGHAPDREIVGLRAAARVHDFRRLSVDKGGNGCPRLVESGFRPLSEVVDARGVAELVPCHGHDGIEDVGADRGCRVVVEIDAHR